MSEEIRIVLPAEIAQALRKKALEKKMKVNDLVIRAIVAVLEDKV